MPKPIFSPQRYLQTHSEPVQRPAEPADNAPHPPKENILSVSKGKREWLMARGLCHYQCFDLSDITPLKREDVLQLKIRQWSPFTDTASYIAWHKGKAQVWIWDNALQQQAQQAQDLKNLPVRPESALRPPKTDDGVQILKTADGIEAQIWQQGVLRSSRWWQQVPDKATWQRFLRSNAQPYTPLPETIPAPDLLAKPWAKNQNALHSINLLWRQERLWVALGAALLLSAFIWESALIKNWQAKNLRLDKEIEQMSFKADPVLDARNRALTAKQSLETMQQLAPYPNQLRLLLAVASKLPEGAVLQNWKYETGTLTLTIKAEEIDPREYVSLFQSIDYFDEVKLEDSRKADEIQIQMQVLPSQQDS